MLARVVVADARMRRDHGSCFLEPIWSNFEGDERTLVADAEDIEYRAQMPEHAAVAKCLGSLKDVLLVNAQRVADWHKRLLHQFDRSLERIQQLSVDEIQL